LLATVLIRMIVDRSACSAVATSATVASPRTSRNQISYFCDGDRKRLERRFLGPDFDSFSDMN